MGEQRFTVAQIAKQTGWSVQKVRNAARKLGLIQESQQGKTLSFSQDQTQVLARFLGTKDYTNQTTQELHIDNVFADVIPGEEQNSYQVEQVDANSTGNLTQFVRLSLPEYAQLQKAQNLYESALEQEELARGHARELEIELKSLREELKAAQIELAYYKANAGKRLSMWERLTGKLSLPLLPGKVD